MGPWSLVSILVMKAFCNHAGRPTEKYSSATLLDLIKRSLFQCLNQGWAISFIWRLRISISERPWSRELSKEYLRFRSCPAYHLSPLKCIKSDFMLSFRCWKGKWYTYLIMFRPPRIQNHGQSGWASQSPACGANL